MKKTSIGGQALVEGIMMRGPENTAMAVRDSSGKIIIEEWKTGSNVPKIFRIPILRGIYGMVTSLTVGYKCMMRSADIAMQDILEEENSDKSAAGEKNADKADTETSTERKDTDSVSDTKKNEKKSDDKKESPAWVTLTMVISIILAFVLMIGLFIMLPTFIGGLIFSETEGFWSRLGRSAFEGIFKILLLIGYMWAISFMKDIRRTFMYHGAEHKTIFCYENGLPLTVENIRKQGRFHPRCGTSFLILMLIVGIFVGFFITVDSWALRFIIRLALLPLTVGIGYELIKFAGRHDNLLTKIISAPGVALQHITVLEPDDSMIECAIEAMNRVIPEDPDKDNW